MRKLGRMLCFAAAGAVVSVLVAIPAAGERGRPRVRIERPDFISRVERDDNLYAMRISVEDIVEGQIREWQSGIQGSLKNGIEADEEKGAEVRINFEARHISGSDTLAVCRSWGGSSIERVKVGPEWDEYSLVVRINPGFAVGSLMFTPVEGIHMTGSVMEIGNITAVKLDAEGNPATGNLMANGDFEENTEGWTGYTRVYEEQ